MFAQYYNYTDKELPYFTVEEKRLDTIREMVSVLKHEEHLIYEHRRRADEEEENKR